MNDVFDSLAADERLRQVLDRTMAAALAVSGAAAGRVCEDLVQSLAAILGTDAALIGEFIDPGRTRMRTLAVWYDGRHLQSFEYDVAHSPCRHIVGRDSRFVASGVHGEFAPGTLFAEQGFDAYAGYSLFDANDEQVGLIVALGRRPLADPELTEALMKIFAVRAAAELERRRAAAALRVSETSYRAIFQAAQDAMFVHDWDTGAFIDVNPRACEVYGYTREEMLRASVAELSSNVPPFTLAEAVRHIEAAKSGRTVRFEWQRRNKDGTLHWDEVVLQPVELGGERRILAVTREITERKAAEQALRASEARLRATVDSALDCVLVVDAEGRVIEFNPAAETAFGRRRADVIGEEMAELLIPPRLREAHRAGMRRVHAGGAHRMVGRRVEMAAMRADGAEFPVEMAIAQVVSPEGPLYVGFLRDITERKRTEQALRDSESLYRGLFNASADAMVLRDAEFRVVDVNPSYTTMSGYTREETLGVDRLLTVDERQNALWREAHARMLAGEHVRFEFGARRKDGTPYEAEVRGMPVSWNDRPHVLYVTRDITERKQAERALAASEEQYRGIFNASADALVLWNSELRVVDVNPAYLRIYRQRREAVVGFGYPAHYPRQYVEARQALIRRALAGETCELQTQSYRADGERFDVEWRVVPVLHRGEPHALAIARDITERKRAEAALQLREEQYRVIFDGSADALVLWDEAIRIVDVNRAFTAMYGFAREEVIGGTLDSRMRPEEVAKCTACMRAALRGQEQVLETETLRKNGETFFVELRYLPITHAGKPHALAIARDITERKRAEERLRASEEQYRAIFSASADAMVLRDEHLRVVDVNPAFLALIRRPREQIVGHVQPAFVIAPEREAAEALLRGALAGRPGKLEVQTVSADGVRREVEVRAVPMQYQGRPHVLAIARDVTAERRAERESRRLEAQLRQAQKMEAIGQLTGGIAHDFNNILASVMGYVVLAEERASDRDDAKTVEYLGQALASCRRARDLIQQMLTFSRGGRGEPRAVDLGALVREAAPMLRASLPSTLSLVQECEPQAPAVWVDEVQAHQVLLNLAINARDAMPAGGEIRIGVHIRQLVGASCASCRHALAGAFVELAVADSGVGVAPELVERIFDPFFTTKAPGKGSGMGLSMVHGIVHEYGGHVVVDSTPGEGSVFRVLWPASAAPPPQALAAPRSPRHQRLRGRVMVVDDEPAVLGTLRELLTLWGLEVDAHSQPDAALAAFEAAPERFDLVITDLTMPQRSGLELAALLRSRRDVPVVLASGYIDERAQAAAREQGFAAVLRKPVEPADLRAAVEAALGGPRQQPH